MINIITFCGHFVRFFIAANECDLNLFVNFNWN